MKTNLMTVDWVDGKLRLIDQTILPARLEYIDYTDYVAVAEAIKIMVVRGAPAIGCTAALGMAVGARQFPGANRIDFDGHMQVVAGSLKGSRPTAVNLFWAVDRQLNLLGRTSGTVAEAQAVLLDNGIRMLQEDIDANRAMGQYGAEILPVGGSILTHCNAGALATVAYGTALGVVRAAFESGKCSQVYADETRPRLQGMKLTAWELIKDGIPVTIIADNMAAVLMREGKIGSVVVGADRIAANGDTANKIGTYGLAVQARHHNVPFYVAAPFSTVDFELANGSLIPIEERPDTEMTHIDGIRIAPENARVWNPAFDVTPNNLVTAIITEKGVIRTPYTNNLQLLAKD